MRTKMTEMLGVEHPIVGFNRSPAVVAEVSKAGGFGVLAATAYKPDELDAQLTWIEEQVGDRPYGIDLLVPNKAVQGDPNDLAASLRAQIPEEHLEFVADLLERYGIPPLPTGARSSGDGVNADASLVPQLLDVAFSHRISLVASALGTPPPHLVERAQQNGVVVASLVGKREHAERQLAAGVDMLVAQGTEAGGHTGTIATTVLTPEIVDIAGDVPVLAAGGIASGRQIAAALALGAAGVWCGSVWLSTHEDIAPRGQGEVPRRRQRRHGALPDPDRQTRAPVAQRLARRVGRTRQPRTAAHAAADDAHPRGVGPHRRRRRAGARRRQAARIVLHRPGRRLLHAAARCRGAHPRARRRLPRPPRRARRPRRVLTDRGTA